MRRIEDRRAEAPRATSLGRTGGVRGGFIRGALTGVWCGPLPVLPTRSPPYLARGRRASLADSTGLCESRRTAKEAALLVEVENQWHVVADRRCLFSGNDAHIPVSIGNVWR